VRAITDAERESLPSGAIEFGNQGLLVTAVAPRGPASELLIPGDILTTIEDKALTYVYGIDLQTTRRDFAGSLGRVGLGEHPLRFLHVAAWPEQIFGRVEQTAQVRVEMCPELR
jgi:hypothetical protein